MKISIIIPNFNGLPFLKSNLPDAVKFFNNPKSNILEIIIVDDYSTDDSINFLTGMFKKDIRLIKHTKHRGYAAAVNTGVRSSKADIIYILDTNMNIESKAVLSKQRMFDDTNLFSINFLKRRLSLGFNNGYIYTSFDSKKTAFDYGISVFGNGLFKKSIWQEVGGMDEQLFNDQKSIWIDLYFRSAKRGFANLMSVLNNDLLFDDANDIGELDRLLLVWKNIHSKAFIKKHIDKIIRRLLSNPKYLTVIFSSILKLGTLIKLRRKELRDCRVSDEAVFSQYS